VVEKSPLPQQGRRAQIRHQRAHDTIVVPVLFEPYIQCMVIRSHGSMRNALELVQLPRFHINAEQFRKLAMENDAGRTRVYERADFNALAVLRTCIHDINQWVVLYPPWPESWCVIVFQPHRVMGASDADEDGTK
jgi:hypothetical protein